MEGALAWIGAIAEWIGQWIPRWQIVTATEAGIKFIRGKKVVPLRPGIHFWWPATTVLRLYPTARQSVNLQTQTILTKDGRTVAVGGLLIYRITDIEAILARTYDADQTIKDIAAGALHAVCSERTYEELADQAGLGQALRWEMRKRLRPFGVKVLAAPLTDFAPCRVYKLIQAQSADAI